MEISDYRLKFVVVKDGNVSYTLQVDETLVFVLTIPSNDGGDFYKELFMVRFINGEYRLCAKDGYDDTIHFCVQKSYEGVISFLTHVLTI